MLRKGILTSLFFLNSALCFLPPPLLPPFGTGHPSFPLCQNPEPTKHPLQSSPPYHIRRQFFRMIIFSPLPLLAKLNPSSFFPLFLGTPFGRARRQDGLSFLPLLSTTNRLFREPTPLFSLEVHTSPGSRRGNSSREA